MMEYFWNEPDADLTLQDIVDRSAGKKNWNKSTVSIYFKKLREKGMIVPVRKESYFLYYKAALTKKEYQQIAINESLERNYGYGLNGMIASYCGKEQLTKDDMERLNKVLEEIAGN